MKGSVSDYYKLYNLNNPNQNTKEVCVVNDSFNSNPLYLCNYLYIHLQIQRLEATSTDFAEMMLKIIMCFGSQKSFACNN